MADGTTGYNGWTNYETWAVSLWIGNELASSGYWADEAQAAWDDATADGTFSREERAEMSLAERLKDDYETGKDELLEDARKSASVWADLLGAALSEVNWGEIARSLLEDVDRAEPVEVADEE